MISLGFMLEATVIAFVFTRGAPTTGAGAPMVVPGGSTAAPGSAGPGRAFRLFGTRPGMVRIGCWAVLVTAPGTAPRFVTTGIVAPMGGPPGRTGAGSGGGTIEAGAGVATTGAVAVAGPATIGAGEFC